jgi:NhaP-type Na+/H+ or K+/H+ antiporter
MHDVAERLERLLTLFVLLVLGIALTRGLLAALDWRGVAIGLGLIFVIRPLAAWVSLSVRRKGHDDGITTGERWAIAFFGVRGVGSLYYLAYASKEDSVLASDLLWSTVGFTIVASVLVHGVLSTPVMARLGKKPEPQEQEA